MKKRLIALFTALLVLGCCVGISAFAEDIVGEEPIIPVVEPMTPDAPPIVTAPPVEPPAPTEVPPTTPPTEPPIITAPPVVTEPPVVTMPPTVPPTLPPAAPVIIKDPGAETVKSGEGCIFVAKADNYTGISWYFTKNDQIVYASEAAAKFPGLKISGDGTEILSLESIPDSLNGWNVGALFVNAVGRQGTATCTITVTPSTSPTPQATPTPRPTASPSPTPTATPTPSVSPTMTVTPPVSPTPEVETEETERGGFSLGLLLLVLLAVMLIGGSALLFNLYRSRRSGGNATQKPVRKSRDDYDEYDEYEDIEDDDGDGDNGRGRGSYKGKH